MMIFMRHKIMTSIYFVQDMVAFKGAESQKI